MNVRRGLFRVWIFVSILWAGGIIAAAIAWGPDTFKNKNYQYMSAARPGIDLFGQAAKNAPHYELWRSPAKEKLTPEFPELEWQYVSDWDKAVKDGRMQAIQFPDLSSLYLSNEWSGEDKTYLSKEFWGQRWYRWATVGAQWLGWAVIPPAVLFLLGWALLWVGRGFVRD